MKEDIVLANDSLNKWCNTEGVNYYEEDTALGFLFKYAVPKLETLTDMNFYCKDEVWEVRLSLEYHKGFRGIADTPALALLWAIYEVICNNTSPVI